MLHVALVPLSRPPCRRWIVGRNSLRSQRYKLAALVGIAPDLRAILAAHVPFEFVDRCCLRSPHDVQGDGLVCVAAKAFHFEVAVSGVERIAERGRWLRWSLKAEHTLVPRRDGEPVGFLA